MLRIPSNGSTFPQTFSNTINTKRTTVIHFAPRAARRHRAFLDKRQFRTVSKTMSDQRESWEERAYKSVITIGANSFGGIVFPSPASLPASACACEEMQKWCVHSKTTAHCARQVLKSQLLYKCKLIKMWHNKVFGKWFRSYCTLPRLCLWYK